MNFRGGRRAAACVSLVVSALGAGSLGACVGSAPAPGGPGAGDAGAQGTTDGGVPDAAVLAPDAAPPLGCPLGCLPPAPAGWTGPSAVYDGPAATKPGACPALYTRQEIEAHQGMTAGPAGCDCGSPTFASARCTAGVELWPDATCSGALVLFDGTATSGPACHSVTQATASTDFIKLAQPTLTRGSCAFPNPRPPALPDPAFSAVNLACGLPQAGACAENAACTATPVPAAPFSRVCIHQEGDALCPSADYAQRFVAFRTLVEGRACEACTGAPVGGACGNMWGFSANMLDCAGGAVPRTHAANACVTNPGVGALVDIRAMAPTGITCAPSGGKPTGNATSRDPVTFCCNK